MTDYIKRTDAVKIAEKYGLANGSVLGRHTGLADCIARDISELPAADVAPVRHGRWIDGDPYCPICRKDKFRGLDADIWADWQPDYCPNCGAKMDGGGGNSAMA